MFACVWWQTEVMEVDGRFGTGHAAGLSQCAAGLEALPPPFPGAPRPPAHRPQAGLPLRQVHSIGLLQQAQQRAAVGGSQQGAHLRGGAGGGGGWAGGV
jgi:predicted component of type VI protein secretion system